MKYIFFMASLIFLVSSCVTLSKEQCQSMDWFEKGKVDGLRGSSSENSFIYQNQCDQFGIKLFDEKNYFCGRTEGLASFCTCQNGEDLGKKGGFYHGVCPSNLEADFLKGYHVGKKELDIRKREEELGKREEKLRADESQMRTQKVLSQIGRKECNLNSDCKMEDRCTFSRCDRSGASCTFQSDCTIKGRCVSGTTRVNGEYVHTRLCQ